MNRNNLASVQTASGQLETAFALFNDLSTQLSTTYRELEGRVTRLSAELAEARSEKLRQLEEKEKLAHRLEGLLTALPGGVIVLDRDDHICQANPVARDMLGDDIDSAAWQSVASRKLAPVGDELQLTDGRWISLSVESLGEDAGRILLLTDVSESRRLQVQCQRQQRLTSLGEMVASLAHQLRTPLSAALLYVSSLKHPGMRNADVCRMVEKTRERLHHLERMINDMLVFVRGDIARTDHIQLPGLVEQLEIHLGEQFRNAGMSLTVCNKVMQQGGVGANRDILLSAMQNLADNALEAIQRRCEQAADTELHGALKIEFELAADDFLEIRFIDNGCGIATAEQERVLEPFYTTRHDGTGLGLAVVNASVSAFRGSLSLTSAAGEGSCFCLRLPWELNDTVLPSGLINSEKKDEKEVSL